MTQTELSSTKRYSVYVVSASAKKPAAAAKPAVAAKAAPKAAVEEEEEEDDLFGSDTEEDKAHEAALKAKVAAARAGKAEVVKPKGRSLIVLEVKVSRSVYFDIALA
jgi:elongation factor 1-beta